MIRRSRVRVGAKARARIRAGGPTSVHRPALNRIAWRALVAACTQRDRGRCRNLECPDPRRPLDPHHVVKRSLGGADSMDNVVMLCRACHDRTDAPYSLGKLVVRSLGDGRFCMALVTAEGKSEGRAKADALLAMAERSLVEA